jgi:hypothetical protein
MKLSRRNFLRGASGLTLALPLLEAFEVRGQTMTPPKRIVWVFTANGDQISQRFTSRGETNWVFADMLTPFERVRSDIIVLDGVNKYHGNLPDGQRADAHEQGGSALAPWKSGSGSFPIGGTSDYIGYVLGPSADRAIGDRLLTDNPSLPQRHLNFRVGDNGGLNIWNVTAHQGPEGTQAPISPDTNPFAAYTRLFMNIDLAGQQMLARRLAMRQSALDLVNGELTALMPKVSTADRAKLQQHSDSLRDVERQLTSMSGSHPSCQPLTMPSMFDVYNDNNYAQVGQLFFKIIAMSFACDLVRTVSFAWSGNTSDRVYGDLGMTQGHHTMSHMSDDVSFGNIRAIKKNLFNLSTKLHDELKAIPENGKTLFDSSLVMHWSELSQGDTHQTDKDLVVLGGGGGYFRTGRMVDLNSASVRGFSNLLISCWQYMGYTDVTSWGEPLLLPDGTGPLPGLT